MKNKGCISFSLYGIGAFSISYGLSKLIYWIFVPGSAKSYSFYHENIISFHDNYTTLGGGTLTARLITTLLFSVVLSVFIWLILRGLTAQFGNQAAKEKIDKGAFRFFLIVLTLGVFLNLFVPKRMVIFDQEEQKVVVSDYGSLLLFLPNPFDESTTELDFNTIQNFHYETGEDLVRGASHDIAMLFMTTTAGDTIAIGQKQVRHGEFGWLKFWKSRSKSLKKAESKSESIVDELTQIVSIQ